MQMEKLKKFKNNYLECKGNYKMLHFWLIDMQSVNHFHSDNYDFLIFKKRKYTAVKIK